MAGPSAHHWPGVGRMLGRRKCVISKSIPRHAATLKPFGQRILIPGCMTAGQCAKVLAGGFPVGTGWHAGGEALRSYFTGFKFERLKFFIGISLHVKSHVSFKRAPRKFLQKHCNRAWVVFRIRLVRTTLLLRLVWSWPVVRSYTAARLRARRLSHCGRPYPILLDLTGTFRSLHISYLWFFAYLALALHVFYLPCHRVASKPLLQLYLPVNWQGKGKNRFSKGTSIEFPSDGIEGAIAIYVCLLEETSSSLLARREGVTFCAVRTVGWL